MEPDQEPLEPAKKPAKATTAELFRKNREVIISLGAVLGVSAVIGLMALIFSPDSKTTEKPKESTHFIIPEKAKRNASEESDDTAGNTTNLYLFHPDSKELLEELEGLSYQKLRIKKRDLPGLHIMWPAYFFAITKKDGKMVSVMLDAQEDGFGAILTTEINIEQYPEIMTLTKGQKIWLAAEITGFDLTGTGQFSMRTEYVSFRPERPESPPVIPEDQTTAGKGTQ